MPHFILKNWVPSMHFNGGSRKPLRILVATKRKYKLFRIKICSTIIVEVLLAEDHPDLTIETSTPGMGVAKNHNKNFHEYSKSKYNNT